MIYLHVRMLPDPARIKSATSRSPFDRASDRATEAGIVLFCFRLKMNRYTLRREATHSRDCLPSENVSTLKGPKLLPRSIYNLV